MCGSSNGSAGKIHCHYQGERVTYATAEAICIEAGKIQIHPGSLKEPRAGDCANGLSNGHFKSWSSAWCNTLVKIDLESGYTAIVHEVEPDFSVNGTAEVLTHVSSDNVNFFKSYWDNGLRPANLNDCISATSCYVHNNDCICSIDTSQSQVFGSASEISSIDQLMSALPVGAVDPATFDGTYSSIDCGIPGVTVYLTGGGDCFGLSSDTVFAFEWKNKQFHLKNQKSTVHIVDSDWSFRNPVNFISLADEEVRVSMSLCVYCLHTFLITNHNSNSLHIH